VRASKILCTLLLFGSLAVEANEATAPKDTNSPMTAVDSAIGRDVHTTAKPVNGRASARTVAEKGAGARDRDTGAAVASRPANMPSRPGITQQVGRANADRLHSLLAAQARGRVVRQPVSHPVGSARAPTFMGGAGQQRPGANVTQFNGTQFGAMPARQLTRGVASPAPVAWPSAGRPAPTLGAARPVPTLSAVAVHSTNGLPRAPGLGVVGGPVVGRGARNSSIDGTTRLRQKF
jgi:hypothetical protein